MEQLNEPRGAANEINAQPDPCQFPSDVPIYRAEAPDARPPVTFAEAEAHNPFNLLTELHDHAMALRLHDKPPTFHLTELALSAAVVAWWSRWQPIAMHRALVAGASLAEIAAARGYFRGRGVRAMEPVGRRANPTDDRRSASRRFRASGRDPGAVRERAEPLIAQYRDRPITT